ncbi:hypothetical protein Pelo_1681 [Pelomyxa schiedti]|nr:hypothetical protein Pelo_1681 [Pelomyxa schiedti]
MAARGRGATTATTTTGRGRGGGGATTASSSGLRSGDKAGSRWQFCSDHLPICVSIAPQLQQQQPQGASARVASWNCLNTAFMRYIYKDEQGLNGSAITADDHPAEHGDGLTVRELKTLQVIKDLFNEGRVDVLALQEVGGGMLKKLKSMDPAKVEGVWSSASGADANHTVVMYNKERTQLQNWFWVPYEGKPHNAIVDCRFTVVGADGNPAFELRVVGTHVPFGSGLSILSQYIHDIEQEVSTAPIALIVLGDCNGTSQHVSKALGTAGVRSVTSQPPPYFTHINAHLQICDYDNASYGALGTTTCDPTCVVPYTFQYIPPHEFLSNPTFLSAVQLINGRS